MQGKSVGGQWATTPPPVLLPCVANFPEDKSSLGAYGGYDTHEVLNLPEKGYGEDDRYELTPTFRTNSVYTRVRPARHGSIVIEKSPSPNGAGTYYEGEYTELLDGLPEVYSAFGYPDGSENEYSAVASTIIAKLVSYGEIDLDLHTEYPHFACERGIQMAGSVLALPGCWKEPDSLLDNNISERYGSLSYQRLNAWMCRQDEIEAEELNYYGLTRRPVSYTLNYARGHQLATQLLCARMGDPELGAVSLSEMIAGAEHHQRHHAVFRTERPVSHHLPHVYQHLPDLALNNMFKADKGIALDYGCDYDLLAEKPLDLLRYVASSETPVTSHIFEPNPCSRLSWEPIKNSDRIRSTDYRFNKKREGREYVSRREPVPEETMHRCRVGDVILGRKLPDISDCSASFESERVALALHTMSRLGKDDPLRVKAEHFITSMNFQPIAANIVYQQTLNKTHSPCERRVVVEPWLEYCRHNDWRWYADKGSRLDPQRMLESAS